MASYLYLQTVLSAHLRRAEDGGLPAAVYEDLAFLDDEPLRTGCLYLADRDALCRAAQAGVLHPGAGVVLCAPEGGGDAPQLPGVQLLETELPLLDAMRLLQPLLRRRWHWERQLYIACYEQRAPGAILRAAAAVLERPVYLLDANLAVVASAGQRIAGALTGELERTAHLSAATAERLFTAPLLRQEGLSVGCTQLPDGDGVCVSFRFPRRTGEWSTLLACDLGASADLLLALQLCRQALARLEQIDRGATAETPPFLTFLMQLLPGTLETPNDIHRLYQLLGFPFDGARDFYHWITIESQNADEPEFSRLRSALRKLLPDDPQGIYDGRLVLLHRSPDDFYRPRDLDLPALDALLRRHACRACIGDCDRLEHMRDRYYLNAQAHKLDSLLRRAQSHAFFFVNDYLEHMLLELACAQFRYGLGGTDASLLADPRMRMLGAYDRLHGTDLLPTLHTYLLYNRSLSQTADALYVHKNTVSNKIRHIGSMLELDLDDPEERMRLQLSFVLLDYQVKLGGIRAVEIPPDGAVSALK